MKSFLELKKTKKIAQKVKNQGASPNFNQNFKIKYQLLPNSLHFFCIFPTIFPSRIRRQNKCGSGYRSRRENECGSMRIRNNSYENRVVDLHHLTQLYLVVLRSRRSRNYLRPGAGAEIMDKGGAGAKNK